MIESDVMYTHETVMQTKINETEVVLCIGIIFVLACFFVLIAGVIFFFSRSIVKPIISLTNFTQELKQASN